MSSSEGPGLCKLSWMSSASKRIAVMPPRWRRAAPSNLGVEDAATGGMLAALGADFSCTGISFRQALAMDVNLIFSWLHMARFRGKLVVRPQMSPLTSGWISPRLMQLRPVQNQPIEKT